jgi:membrane protease subunit HflK
MINLIKHGKILMNQGPWGAPPNGGGKKGGGGHGGKGNPPDIDDMLRSAQNKFKKFGSRPPQDFNSVKIIAGAAAAIVVLWLATGFYRVEPEENAVIMTFGKWTDTRQEPGLGYHVPYPVQEIIKVNVSGQRRIEIGARGNTAVPEESMMLTGDENIIDINFVVLWNISDAGKYLFRVRDPDQTLKKVAESAMREIIGRTQIQKALTEARGDIEVQTKALMQKILNEYETGVSISNVQLLRVDPPGQVVDAFDDVQRARTDRERLKNEADAYRNDIVPRARGEAQKLIQDAEAYKEAVISKAQGDGERFGSILSAYSQSKEVTQKRLYLETMQEIMQRSKKIIVGENGMPVLPYMNVDQLKGEKK